MAAKVTCEGCKQPVTTGQKFAAIRSDNKWRVMHDAEIAQGDEFATQPRFIMNDARAWVLSR